MIEQWSMIVDAVPPHMITGDLLKSQFSIKEKREEKWVKVNSEVWEEFQHKARSQNLDPIEIMEEIMEEWEAEEDAEMTDELNDDEVKEGLTENLEAWQDDLQALIEEKDRIDNWFAKLIVGGLVYGNST